MALKISSHFRTTVISILLLGFLILAFGVAWILSRQPQDTRQQAASSTASITTLANGGAGTSLTIGQAHQVSVQTTLPAGPFIGIQVVIFLTGNVPSNLQFAPNTVTGLQLVANQIQDIPNGKQISLAFTAPPGQPFAPPQSTVGLGVFTFTPSASGSIVFSFDQANSRILTPSSNENILTTFLTKQYIFVNPAQPTAAPTATPTTISCSSTFDQGSVVMRVGQEIEVRNSLWSIQPLFTRATTGITPTGFVDRVGPTTYTATNCTRGNFKAFCTKIRGVQPGQATYVVALYRKDCPECSEVRACDARLTVSVLPAESPTPTPGTGGPSPTPTPSPTPQPTAVPTPTPTPRPTAVPTPSPTVVPTATPTPVATVRPTASPTPLPTASGTPSPTSQPSASATPTPTPNASVLQRSDLDNDQKITINDIQIMITSFFRTGPSLAGDVNSDGKVNLIDYALMVRLL